MSDLAGDWYFDWKLGLLTLRIQNKWKVSDLNKFHWSIYLSVESITNISLPGFLYLFTNWFKEPETCYFS